MRVVHHIEDYFEVVVHHDRHFVNGKKLDYLGGEYLDKGLKTLVDDNGEIEMINITKAEGKIYLFVLHPVNDPCTNDVAEGSEKKRDKDVAEGSGQEKDFDENEFDGFVEVDQVEEEVGIAAKNKKGLSDSGYYSKDLDNDVDSDEDKDKCKRKPQVKGKPIVTMLEEIMVYLMGKWATNRQRLPHFKEETYESVYQHLLYPVNGEYLWHKTWCNNVLPPPIKKMPGRPKKHRSLESGELRRDKTHLRRVGLPKKCSRCHKYGHNKSTCKEPPIHTTTPIQPTELTQGIASTIQTTASNQPIIPTQPTNTSQVTTST
ncbi:hypothetical protein CR513_19646, partial [Mucuna pruriens]